MENNFVNELQSSTALVTGAASGIGAACARAFHGAGASVMLLDRDFSEASETLLTLDRTTRHVADITDAAAIASLFREVGAVDIVVNCAGIVPGGSITTCPPEDFRNALEVNVTGTYTVTRAAVQAALDAGRALSIVNIASVISSLATAPDRLAYGTSKAALLGMTKSVALDYVRNGIRCNAVCPGTIDTPSLRQRIAARSDAFGSAEKALEAFHNRQPIGRLGTPEEIAELVLFVAGNRTGFMTGAILTADGGFTL